MSYPVLKAGSFGKFKERKIVPKLITIFFVKLYPVIKSTLMDKILLVRIKYTKNKINVNEII